MALEKGLMIAPSADGSGRTKSRRCAIGNMTRWTVHSCGPTKFRGEVAVDGLLKGMTVRVSACQLCHMLRTEVVSQGMVCMATCQLSVKSRTP